MVVPYFPLSSVVNPLFLEIQQNGYHLSTLGWVDAMNQTFSVYLD
jgi:hypothetical protein